MAKKLDSFPAKHRPPYGKYPFHEWADGNVWEAVQGVDFKCSLISFAALIYKHADRNGIKCRVHKPGDKRVIFQFYKPEV